MTNVLSQSQTATRNSSACTSLFSMYRIIIHCDKYLFMLVTYGAAVDRRLDNQLRKNFAPINSRSRQQVAKPDFIEKWLNVMKMNPKCGML